MNKTIYIKPHEAEVWKKAKKLIDFKTDLTLSEVLTEHLRKVIKQLEEK